MTDRQLQEPAFTEPEALFPDHAHNPDRTGAGIYKPTPTHPVSVGVSVPVTGTTAWPRTGEQVAG